ncbi:hypothetical protein BDY21DRAFT_344644 [Lineolata rhizophorae]|uniref:Uncharacterized protein n=1 Tax=Lineolata rhizophorae TaxID=578093 RepID=A0A6A6NZT4_9PEZI|nr:hypothetical protein BDY21DRAFT_344644 [Lineolata rhizophorae]
MSSVSVRALLREQPLFTDIGVLGVADLGVFVPRASPAALVLPLGVFGVPATRSPTSLLSFFQPMVDFSFLKRQSTEGRVKPKLSAAVFKLGLPLQESITARSKRTSSSAVQFLPMFSRTSSCLVIRFQSPKYVVARTAVSFPRLSNQCRGTCDLEGLLLRRRLYKLERDVYTRRVELRWNSGVGAVC